MTERIDDNPHTVRHPFCWIVYWKRNQHGHAVACGVNDNWSHCVVETFDHYPQAEFTPLQKHDLDKLLCFMQRAYDAGREDKAREIRKVLGVMH